MFGKGIDLFFTEAFAEEWTSAFSDSNILPSLVEVPGERAAGREKHGYEQSKREEWTVEFFLCVCLTAGEAIPMYHIRRKVSSFLLMATIVFG